ncbi:YopJ family acetyltransferase [Burkholderia ubonensis]|uniref:YopJ family acetyltransferase n=1 Tax=Burkholderia ubonensis TaxID=101571 RepID=UPI0009B34B15|nr:YopJ family acetyltransferase [Burkholderia ubonensis]
MLGPISGAPHFVQPYGEKYKEALGKYISEVEKDLNSGLWPNVSYARIDKSFMPGLVESANQSKPGLNLIYAEDPGVMLDKLREAINNGTESERYIANLGDDGVHFAAFDYRLIDGTSSLLMFEPVNFNAMGALMLSWRVQRALEGGGYGRDVKFYAIAMDIQRSCSECGIFSLALAKKLHKESDPITELHRMNSVGSISFINDPPSSPIDFDKLVPPSLYKHTQSRGRLTKYIESNPGSDAIQVNKKGDTLLDRQMQHMQTIVEKDPLFNTEQTMRLVNSIHQKRLVELKQLMKILNDE